MQRGVSLPPLQSPLPASNLAAVRFPRLHLLASGRPGYGILPFPTSGPRPCGPDLARQLRLGDVDAGHNPTADILVFSVRAYWRSCMRDLARQLRLGEVYVGHNPTADILVFSMRAYWRFCARDLACLLCLGKVDAGPEPSLLLQ